MENNIIKEIITTLSRFRKVNYRMITDSAEFYKAGKLYNEQLYLLYKTDQLTQVSLEDMNNLKLSSTHVLKTTQSLVEC